jgi:hypothetical protein
MQKYFIYERGQGVLLAPPRWCSFKWLFLLINDSDSCLSGFPSEEIIPGKKDG